jgi:PilZ domain
MPATTANSPLTDDMAHPTTLHAGFDRRRSLRAELNWSLYLTCDRVRHSIHTQSENISKDGFYCFVKQPIPPGEVVQCDIAVPAHNPNDPHDVLYLRCRARVLRLEKAAIGDDFGLACRIEDYSVIRPDSVDRSCEGTAQG